MTSSEYSEYSEYSDATDYAYVCLVMKGDYYIKGAIVMAHSIRLSGSLNDIVCMVTPEVSEYGRRNLGTVFDYVVDVPYLEFETKRLMSKKIEKRYGDWKSVAYTKWNVLNMTQYKKVMFMDADVIVTKNIDELFDLRTPAATFSLPQAKPYKKSGVVNHYNKYGHGHQIHPDDVTNGLEYGFVGIGTTIVLTPCARDFDDFKTMMSDAGVFGFGNCINGPDEQSICVFYHNKGDQWTNINQVFNMIPWRRGTWMPRKGRWANVLPYVHHYVGEMKPWDMDRGRWDDLREWWAVYDDMMAHYPVLKYVL